MTESNQNNINRQLFNKKSSIDYISPTKVKLEDKGQLKIESNHKNINKVLKESLNGNNLQLTIKQKDRVILQINEINKNIEKDNKKFAHENERLKIQKQQMRLKVIKMQSDFKIREQKIKENNFKNIKQMQQSLQSFRKHIVKLEQQKQLLSKSMKKDIQQNKVKSRRIKEQFQQEKAQLKSKILTKQQQLSNIEKILYKATEQHKLQLHQNQQYISQINKQNHQLKRQIQVLKSKILDFQTQKQQLQQNFKQDLSNIQKLIKIKERQLTSFYQQIQSICNQFKDKLKLQSQSDNFIELLRLFIKELSPRNKIHGEQNNLLRDQLQKNKKQNLEYKNKIFILEDEIKFIKNNRAVDQKYTNIIKNHLSQLKQQENLKKTKEFKTPQKSKYQSKVNNKQNSLSFTPSQPYINQKRSPIMQINDKQNNSIKNNSHLQQNFHKPINDKLRIITQTQYLHPNINAIISKYDHFDRIHNGNGKMKKIYEQRLNQQLMKNNTNIQNKYLRNMNDYNDQNAQFFSRKRSLVNIMYRHEQRESNRRSNRCLTLNNESKILKKNRATSLTTIISNKCRDQIS